jgi:hypothetical protein
MRCLIDQDADIEQIQNKVFDLITQCVQDIQKTVNSSGFHMRDVGVGIEMYNTKTGSRIVELRLRQ